MFRVKLKEYGILGNIYEQDLLESSAMESINKIRKLRALIEFLKCGFVNVSQINDRRQAYQPYYNVWFGQDEWEEYNE